MMTDAATIRRPVLPSDLVANTRAKIQELDVLALAERLHEQSVVIDVREPTEFIAGHIAGAMNIPRGVLEFEIQSHPRLRGDEHPVIARPQTEIILYCRSGGRSALAAASLEFLGFSNVFSLAGGILAWQSADLPVRVPESSTSL